MGNSRYYDYNMSRNGRNEQHRSDYSADYFTVRRRGPRGSSQYCNNSQDLGQIHRIWVLQILQSVRSC